MKAQVNVFEDLVSKKVAGYNLDSLISGFSLLKTDENNRLLLPKVFSLNYMKTFLGALLHRFLRIEKSSNLGWIRSYYKTDLASLRYLTRTILGMDNGGKKRVIFIKESDLSVSSVAKNKFAIIVKDSIQGVSEQIMEISKVVSFGYMEMRKILEWLRAEQAPNWLIKEYLSIYNEWVILTQNLFADYFGVFRDYHKDKDVILRTISMSAKLEWDILKFATKRIHFDEEKREFIEKTLEQWSKENWEKKNAKKISKQESIVDKRGKAYAKVFSKENTEAQI